jgi:hypothetical protein
MSNPLKKILLLTFFTKIYFMCGKGCLSCDFEVTPSHCLLCDVSQNFIFDPETLGCKKIKLQNCLELIYEIKNITEQNNNPENEIKLKTISTYYCQQCSQGMKFNFNENICQKVEKPIEGCELYSNSNECILCKHDNVLFVDSNECVPFTLLPYALKACKKFSSNSGLCLECDLNYTLLPVKTTMELESDFSFCVESSSFFNIIHHEYPQERFFINNEKQDLKINPYSPEEDREIQIQALTSNCQEFSVFSCQNCHGLTNMFKWSSFNSLSWDYLRQNSSKVHNLLTEYTSETYQINQNYLSPCVVSTIANCFKYAQVSPNFKSCSECEKGYSLIENQCIFNDHPKIKHCMIYSSLSSCATCEEGFVLFNNIHCVPIFETYNCQIFDNIGGCQKCESSFYLDRETNICMARENSILNCVDISDFDDNCYQCEDSHFLYLTGHSDVDGRVDWELDGMSFDTYKDYTCYQRPKYPIDNCKETSLYFGQCLQCEPNYILSLSNFSCLPEIANCVHQMEDFTNSFHDPYTINGSPDVTVSTSVDVKFPLTLHCLECAPGFAPSVDLLSCESLSIPNCLKHSPHSAICLECENLYYFDIDTKYHFREEIQTKCLKMTDENCLSNYPNYPLCKKCKSGFYISPGKFQKQATTLCVPMESEIDPKCTANTSSDDNAGCSHCVDGFESFKVTNHIGSSGYKLTEGCARFDRRNLNCLECKMNYGSLHEKCDTKDDQSVCSKLVPFSLNPDNSLLADSDGKCLKCRDNSRYYLYGYTCRLRTKALYNNCKLPNLTKDSCKLCNENYFPYYLTNYIACSPKSDQWVEIEHCKAYDINYTKCILCSPGYELNQEKCIFIFDSQNQTNIWVPLWMNANFIVKPHKMYNDTNTTGSSDTLEKDCLIWIQSSVTTIECVKCKGVGIIKKLGFDYKTNKSNFNLVTNSFEFYSNHYTIYDCLPEDSFAKIVQYDHKDTTDFIKNQKCLFAEEVYNDKYKCVTCTPGYEPLIKTIYYFESEESRFKTELFGIADCTPQTTFESKYEGMTLDILIAKQKSISYYTYTTNYHTTLYDSCSDLQSVLVIFPHSYNQRLMHCIKKSEMKVQIENCQLYQWNNSKVDLSSENISDWKCIACQPGYSPKFEITSDKYKPRLSSCEPVIGCDLGHSKNTWMNTCAPEAIQDDYSFSVSLVYNDVDQIHFGDILNINGHSNPKCLLWNDIKEICYFCKKGFNIDRDGNCHTAKLTNCQEHGVMWKTVNHIDSSLLSFMQNIIEVSPLLNNLYQSPRDLWPGTISTIITHIPGFGCNKCNPDSVPIHSLLSTDLICTNFHLLRQIQHCQEYENSISKFFHVSCNKCEEGYVLTFDKSCQLSLVHSKCRMVNVYNSGQVCIECKDGFFLNELSTCVAFQDDNCLVDFYGGTGQGIITNPDYDWLEGNWNIKFNL